MLVGAGVPFLLTGKFRFWKWKFPEAKQQLIQFNPGSSILFLNMSKTAKAGILVLLLGILTYLIISDGMTCITRALIIGFIIGIGVVLGGQFGKNT